MYLSGIIVCIFAVVVSTLLIDSPKARMKKRKRTRREVRRIRRTLQRFNRIKHRRR